MEQLPVGTPQDTNYTPEIPRVLTTRAGHATRHPADIKSCYVTHPVCPSQLRSKAAQTIDTVAAYVDDQAKPAEANDTHRVR